MQEIRDQVKSEKTRDAPTPAVSEEPDVKWKPGCLFSALQLCMEFINLSEFQLPDL